MKIKSLKSVFSQVNSSVKNFKKTEPQLFWVISICLILSLSFSVLAAIKLSVFKNRSDNTQVVVNPSPTVDVNQPRITGAWEVKPVSDENTPTLEPTDAPLVHESLNLGEISWLQFPQPINLNIFNKTTETKENKYEGDFCYNFNSIKMHKTGTFSDGSYLVNLYIDCEIMGGGTELHRFIYTPSKQVYLLEDWSSFKQIFASTVPVKIADISIKGIEAPKTIKLDNININLSTKISYSFTQITNPQKFSDSPYGPIYISYPAIKNYEPFVNRYFYLRHPDDTISTYETNIDFFSDDGVPKFTLLNGTLNKSQYYIGFKWTGGCGGTTNALIKSKDLNLNDLKKVGTIISDTSLYKDIYQVTDYNNSIVKLLFKGFSTYPPSDKSSISIEEYAKYPTHFLWKDNLGDWIIFTNQSYSSMAECGKPVIYLYPQKESQVKVQVDAKITQSEPTYPTQGWLVTAKPNGELIYQNKIYPYLFWEGLGNGIYPDYQDQGTLVSQKDLVSTIYRQLSQLGLNQKESADFMEFWQPRLPKTPYIRLTWLNTQDMNRLAPLSIEPKPDTTIRIFLEFEGLNKPVVLKPQNLTAPVRNGFTLIEWGGLLIKPAK